MHPLDEIVFDGGYRQGRDVAASGPTTSSVSACGDSNSGIELGVCGTYRLRRTNKVIRGNPAPSRRSPEVHQDP